MEPESTSSSETGELRSVVLGYFRSPALTTSPVHSGAARVAVQVLKHSSAYKERRVLVISTTDRWNFTFYDVEAADHLQLTHNELGSALKAVGGIRFAVGEPCFP